MSYGLFVWLGACIPAVAASPVKAISSPTSVSTPRYVGYFYAASDAYGDYLGETSSYTNLAHLSDIKDPARVLQLNREASGRGQKVVYRVMECFFEPGRPYRLRPDWPARWSRDPLCAPTVASLQASGNLLAVYLADEPYGNGLTRASVNVAAAAVRAQTPGVRSFVVEDGKALHGQEPPEVELFGISCYSDAARPDPFRRCAAEYRDLARRFKGEIVVVAQSFNAKGSAIPDQEPWLELVRSHPRFVALMWFLYPDYDANKGARSDAPVKLAQQRIGRHVLCATGASIDRAKCQGTDGSGDQFRADIDGDRVEDLVVRRHDSGDVDVFLARAGRFLYQGRWTYGYGPLEYDLLLGDVTGDDRADLVARDRKGGDVIVGVSRNQAFASPARWSHGYGTSYQLRLRDVDGDGRSDLVAQASGRLLVARSTGSGFTSPREANASSTTGQ